MENVLPFVVDLRNWWEFSDLLGWRKSRLGVGREHQSGWDDPDHRRRLRVVDINSVVQYIKETTQTTVENQAFTVLHVIWFDDNSFRNVVTFLYLTYDVNKMIHTCQ